MRYAGIIAEYDPFHNGHAWQLAQARRLGAQTVAVALSCGAVQRGSLPLLPESVRVRAALQSGADLVFALPAPWACAGAEQFARGGVALLAAAGCDTLVFGAETPDAELLMLAARTLLSAEYTAALKVRLAGGARSFAAARATAAEQVCPGRGLAALLARPNDNLAVEYCKAVLQQRTGMAVLPLPRQGAQHGAPLGRQAPADGPAAPRYASASALRALWLGDAATPAGPQPLAPYVPAAALPLYREAFAAGQDTSPAALSTALLARLRGMDTAQLARVRGVSEGLEHLLYQHARQAVSAPALYDALTGVRYPRARMRRLCLDAALGYTAGSLPELPPYLHVLGAQRAALPLLAQCALPAGTSLAKLAQQNAACAAAARAQAAADALGTLCRRQGAAAGECFTQPAALLPEE